MPSKLMLNGLLLIINFIVFTIQYLGLMLWYTHPSQVRQAVQRYDDDVLIYSGELKPITKQISHKENNCDTSWNWNWDGRASQRPKVSRFLYLVRHGQYYGSGPYEMHLSPLGEQQAKQTGEKLKSYNITFNRFISSTSVRAAETAGFIHASIHKVNIEYSDELREGWPAFPEPASPGDWDKNNPIFENDMPRIKAGFEKYIHRADPDRKSDSNEIIVTHGNVISYIILRSLQMPVSRWLRIAVLQGSITLLEIHRDGYVDVRFVGDIGHLTKSQWSG